MYHQYVFIPLYNGLVGIMDLFPWIDVGLAVVIFTFIVKLVLFPLSKSSLLTQVRMKEIEPEVNKIKAEYANDKQNQALKTMELYKEKKIKPFSGVLLLLIQLPILLALISVFYKIIPTIHPEYLYSFIAAPALTTARTHFLGLIDLTQKSIILSLLTAVAQFIQLHFSISARQQKFPGGSQAGAAGMAGSLNKQMKYMLPILAFISTYFLIPVSFPQAASIIAIYWAVSAFFTLGQELVIRKRYLGKVAK